MIFNTADSIKNWFLEYTSSFINPHDKECIVLKIEHTLRVTDDITLISQELGLDPDHIALAQICALLHDLGRFEQYRQYKTFSDSKSVDHADFGLKIINQQNILAPLPPDQKDIVLCAVGNHNKLHIPPDLADNKILFCQLLRDADKLDIFKVVTDYYASKEKNQTLELELPDSKGISQNILQAVHKRQDIDYRQINNLNDFKLLQAGWVYSLNYVPSLKIFWHRNYLQKLAIALKHLPEVNYIFEEISSYILQKLNNERT